MVFEKVREIIAEQMSISEDEITLETTFADDLGADSLDLFQIISDLEDSFGIEFQNEDAEKIKTVGDAVNYIEAAK
ncbi:acyl carrier protein [[Clostridium] colinum]|uniref:acyl carrier protein n=1 Tax=[Clostridium] colinum TaxID=36835 RepID=UPI002024D623|nr:acyl carrier protein [[Clostridium] colinum]